MLPVSVSMTITPEFAHFAGIHELIRSCKQVVEQIDFQINLKAKISLQMFNPNDDKKTIFVQPKCLDCIILNQRYLNIRFTLIVINEEAGSKTKQEIRRSVVFRYNQNSEIYFMTRTADEDPFSIKCEIQILPERAEGEHIYPCTYQKMIVPEGELKQFDQRPGCQLHQQIRRPVIQPTQQSIQQRIIQQMQSNVLRGEQQQIARRYVEQQLSLPTSELILGSDGSFFVRSRITNSILYEGTFSVYQPSTIPRLPNTARCTLSSQTMNYQPIYQPIGQQMQRNTTIHGNSYQSQIIQIGLPPRTGTIQPITQQQQQESLHNLRLSTNCIHHCQQLQQKHQNTSVFKQVQTQPQPITKIAKPMEEELTIKPNHEDIEKSMSTGKHYEPISIDLSDDDNTITAENSETEELPTGM